MAHEIDYQVATSELIESEFGARLEQWRLLKNISQARLAEEAGVSRRTITRVENGDGISVDTLIRVMQALGLAERLATLLPHPDVLPGDRGRRRGLVRMRARGSSAPPDESWSWNE